jgi:hypothetical protein
VPRTIGVTIRRRSYRKSGVGPWYELTVKVRPMAHVEHSDLFIRRTTPDEVIRDAKEALTARWRAGDTIHVVGKEHETIASAMQAIEDARPTWQ